MPDIQAEINDIRRRIAELQRPEPKRPRTMAEKLRDLRAENPGAYAEALREQGRADAAEAEARELREVRAELRNKGILGVPDDD